MNNIIHLGYPSFVCEYLQRNSKYDVQTEWVRDSTLLLAGLGSYRAVIYADCIILLQDVRTGEVADLRKIYNTLVDSRVVDYIFNYFLKLVNHTKIIPVYFNGNNHYYYDDRG